MGYGHMKRLSETSIFACFVAGALLVNAAAFSGKAFAMEPEETQTTETDGKGDRLSFPSEPGAAKASGTDKTSGQSASKKSGEAKAAASKSKPTAGDTAEAPATLPVANK